MSTVSGIFLTYNDGNRVEDVMEYSFMLTPTDTPLYSGLKKTKARDVIHSWNVKELTVQQDNAVVEGAEHGTASQNTPTRITNVTQIFEKPYNVSSTENWVKHHGVENQFSEHERDALKKIATDVEHALVRGSLVSGSSVAARRMAGLLNFCTTNATTVSSGTKLTESVYNDMLEMIYENGAPEGTIDEVYVPARLKRVISSYSAGSQKTTDITDKRLINKVDIYESDFGVQKVFMSRYMPKTSNIDASVLFLGNNQNSIAVGEPIRILDKEEVPQNKHGKQGNIRGELTLECNEAWQGVISGLDTSFPV